MDQTTNETREIFWGPVPIIERTYNNRDYDKATGEKLFWKCRSYHCRFYTASYLHCLYLGDFGTYKNVTAIEEGKKNALQMLGVVVASQGTASPWWIDPHGYWQCSDCGEIIDFCDPQEMEFRFCPYCGKKKAGWDEGKEP